MTFKKICPKCGSVDVHLLSKPLDFSVAFSGPTNYECKNCGFVSQFFPEVEDVDDFRKNLKK